MALNLSRSVVLVRVGFTWRYWLQFRCVDISALCCPWLLDIDYITNQPRIPFKVRVGPT
jgi:hypothetical protein